MQQKPMLLRTSVEQLVIMQLRWTSHPIKKILQWLHG